MASFSEEQLLSVIEKDDLKAFNALMEEARCGSYRLGRFPVLSLLYLCSSRKILAAYEDKFLKISSWTALSEPVRLMRRFSKVAGKCLRLYFSEVVSPLEMLIILDKGKHAQKIYPQTKPSEAVKDRIQLIYAIKYALALKFEGNELILARRPLNRSEKKRLSVLCVGCAAALAVMITMPTTAAVLLGPRAGGDVTVMSQINLKKDTTYTLQSDITVSKKYAGKEVNCTIIGNGHKIVFKENATLGEFSGKLTDAEIVTAGSPLFSVCAPTAALTGLTVTVNADIKKTAEATALIARYNYGLIDGVTLNVSGSLTALAGNMDGTEELIFGGMVMENAYYSRDVYGTIQNCTVNYSHFSLKGELMANAIFGGIAGLNRGVVQDCTVTGEITADTFDLGGACYYNGNTLSAITNEANLSQTALDDGWTPIVGGIAVESGGSIETCINRGDLRVEGTDIAISGGIVARTYGSTKYCLSSGNISVIAKTAYAGNIFGRSEIASGSGGMVLYYGLTDRCIGEGKITVSGGGGAPCVGGIGGLVMEAATIRGYLGGVVTNCISMGEIEGDFMYGGNVVGGCGENVYEKNSNDLANGKQVNFEGNCYLANDLPSFGAVVTMDTADTEKWSYREVSGKGAQEATEDEIKDKEIYREIIEKLGI